MKAYSAVAYLLSKHRIARQGLTFLSWTIVFALAYAQSPLYTSNQHQYFLHGLARAGYGYLSRDWLANTLDPTPVFSGLVWLTYTLFHAGWPFYLYYALLMGIYLFSMYHLTDFLFPRQHSMARQLVFLALFIGFHSAALRFVLSRLLGDQATFLFEGGVAGQRLLGQVFQPSVFGVLFVLAIYLFLTQKRIQAILALVMAIYFHPTYLLSGAMLTLAWMVALYLESRDLKKVLHFGLLTLVLVLPVLLYVLWAFASRTGGEVYHANEILVNVRIPTHTLFSAWLDWTVLAKGSLVLLALFLTRSTPFFPIYATLTIETLILTCLQALVPHPTLALLFPWRTSVLLVPLGLSVIIAWLVRRPWSLESSSWGRSVLLGGSLILLTMGMLVGVLRFSLETYRNRSDPAYPLLAYVAAHKTAQDLYLVPLTMAEFRLATGAPILADFKSIPYRADEVLEWYRRVRLLNWFYNSGKPCRFLSEVTAEGVTHIVWPERKGALCSELILLYQDKDYSLYRLSP